ncbi:MAG: CPBP family intramembrane metalloprotease [Odoribacter sp.]|nr:CPBP family intramembrane metalloprotease [Odoribacter sp.]
MFLEQVYTGKNQWYFYVFSLLIIFTATQIGSLPLMGYLLHENPDILKTGDISVATTTNTGLALTLLSFVAGFFAIFYCVKYIHHKNTLSIVTSRHKTDWGRVFFAAGVWGLLAVATLIVPLLTTDSQDIIFQFDPVPFFTLTVISLLLFPFQASFEELLFRGYLMQWAARILKYRWSAVLVTGILFGLMHGANPEMEKYGIWIALPQYILMGLILGYVTVKDDGTELALGLHAANNILAALTLTSDASALQTHALFRDLNPTASWTDTLVMLFTGIIFIWICNRKYRFIHKINLLEKIKA